MCASGEETFDGFRLEVIESKTTRAARASCSVIFQLTIPFQHAVDYMCRVSSCRFDHQLPTMGVSLLRLRFLRETLELHRQYTNVPTRRVR